MDWMPIERGDEGLEVALEVVEWQVMLETVAAAVTVAVAMTVMGMAYKSDLQCRHTSPPKIGRVHSLSAPT